MALSGLRFAPPQGIAGLGVVLGIEGEEPLEPKLPWRRQVVRVCQGHLVAVYLTGVRAVFGSLESALKALDALYGQLGACRFAIDHLSNSAPEVQDLRQRCMPLKRSGGILRQF